MKRRPQRRPLEERSRFKIPDEEYRVITDGWVSGVEVVDLAHKLHRPIAGVRKVIVNVCANYTEGGKRSRPIEDRLGSFRSTLDPSRDPTKRDKVVYEELREAGRTDAQAAVVLNLPLAVVAGIRAQVGFGLLPPNV